MIIILHFHQDIFTKLNIIEMIENSIHPNKTLLLLARSNYYLKFAFYYTLTKTYISSQNKNM